MLEDPFRAAALNQARLRFVAARKCQHFARGKRILEARKRAAHQQRLALPVSAHECGDIERSEVLA